VLLIYDPGRDRYEGERLAVPWALFDDVVADLVAGDLPEGAARAKLLDEAERSEDSAGVEALTFCLHCRKPLPAGRGSSAL
jgi:hypothetical protein